MNTNQQILAIKSNTAGDEYTIVDAVIDIWISNPQRGHWLDEERKAEFVAWVCSPMICPGFWMRPAAGARCPPRRLEARRRGLPPTHLPRTRQWRILSTKIAAPLRRPPVAAAALSFALRS
jgi:hypothetical protein